MGEAPATGMAAVTSAFTTAGGDMVTQLTGLVTGLLPVLLPLVAIMIAIPFGIKIFKKIKG